MHAVNGASGFGYLSLGYVMKDPGFFCISALPSVMMIYARAAIQVIKRRFPGALGATGLPTLVEGERVPFSQFLNKSLPSSLINQPRSWPTLN